MDYYQKKNNYQDSLIEESQEIIYSLYESYIEESKNNKAFSTEWKKLKSDFFKSFKEAAKLANNGNYKEAISKIDECEKNLNEGFEQLSKNTKFTLADNLLAMVKYFIIPIILLIGSKIIILSAQNKAKKMIDSGKYSRQDAIYRNVFNMDPEISEKLATYILNNDINNDKTIRMLSKLAKNFGSFGLGIGLSRAVTYTTVILRDLRNLDSEEMSKSINANYNSAKAIYELLVRYIELFKNYYIHKM